MATARSASLWAIVGNVATRGLSFVFFLLIARVITPAQLGVMALALAAGLLLDALIEFGLVDQVVRHHDGDDQAFFSTVFWLHLGLGIVGLLLMLLGAPFFSHWYREPALREAIMGVALASALTGASLVPAALLTRRFEQKALAKRNAVAAVFGGVVGLSLVYQGQGVRALVALQVVNALTGMLMVWWSAGWRPSVTWDMDRLRPALQLARHSLGSRLMDTVINRLDQVMVGSFFGASALGLYSLAIRLYDVLFQSICLPVAGVMLPYLASVARDGDAFKARYLLVLKTVSLTLPPLFLGGALLLPELLPVLFGQKWLPAAPYIQIILGVGALQAMSFTHSPAFTALGKPSANLLTSTVATLAWLVALLLLSQSSTIFAAILWAGRGVLAMFVQMVLMMRLTSLNLSGYWGATRPAFLSSVALLVTMWGLDVFRVLPPGPWWKCFVGAALALLIMGGTAIRHSVHIKQFLMNRRKEA